MFTREELILLREACIEIYDDNTERLKHAEELFEDKANNYVLDGYKTKADNYYNLCVKLYDEIEKLENPQTVKHKYGCHQNGETEFCDDCMAIDLCSRRYSVVLKQKGGN